MEFKTTSRGGETHNITSTTLQDNAGIQLTVTRIALNGGLPKTITKIVKPDITYSEAMISITKIVELDTEMFNMVSEHTQNKEA